MSTTTRLHPPAFRALERALFRRRLAQLDLRTRGEIALLALLSGGFLFWQIRVPLDGLVRARGTQAGAAAVLALGLVLALLGAVMAGVRHARGLRRGPAGPEWLALPVEPEALERHLAWSSRGLTLWLVVPGLAVLLAGIGLLPGWWLAAIAIVLVALAIGGAQLGCAIGHRAALRHAEQRPALAAIERLLAAASPRGDRRPLPAARWGRSPAWIALARKDVLMTMRQPAARAAASWPIVWFAASLLVWMLPVEPVMRRFLAFALALLAATALAEWLVVVIGTDPFPTLRALPVGVATVWSARVVWGVAGAAGLAVAQAAGARDLSVPARELLLVCTAAATLAIAVLGVNYGVTLFPRSDVAGRILGLSLTLAMAASVMIPLVGWVVLLAAVLHSARRLPRWTRLEEA